jgi:hypothetical protein
MRILLEAFKQKDAKTYLLGIVWRRPYISIVVDRWFLLLTRRQHALQRDTDSSHS